MLLPRHPSRLLFVFPVLTCLLLLTATGCQKAEPEPKPEGWYQFRGPDGTGMSSVVGLPVKWGEGSKNIRWRVPVPGRGNSSPIANRDRIYLTTAYKHTKDDGAQIEQTVLAYDARTGDKVWETSIWKAPPGQRHWMNTRASPTPATDGKHIYVTFGETLTAVDLDGTVVWSKTIEENYNHYTRYGVSSSPIVAGDAVIVLQDREAEDSVDTGWLASFDKATGEERWRTEWMDTCCAYTTPLLVHRHGRDRLLVPLSGRLEEYDLETGKPLWRADHMVGQIVSGLVIEDDIMCTMGGAHNDRGMVCMRLKAEGPPEELWRTEGSGGAGAPQVASPVLYKGRLFMTEDGGRAQALNVLDGSGLWRRRIGLGGNIHASMVAGDGKVYVTDLIGNVTVLQVDDPIHILSRNNLIGGGSTPAITEDCFIIRSEGEMVCLAVKPKPAAAAPAG